MPSVLAETPQLVDAVIASEPNGTIELAAQNRFQDSSAYRHMSSLTGGKLMNMVTASLYLLRELPGQPLSERPIDLDTPAQSYIGKLLINLINQSHGLAPSQSSEHTVSGVNRVNGWCVQAEGNYLDSAKGVKRAGHRPAISVVDREKLVLFQKSYGSITALVTPPQGVMVNDIHIPQGVIGDITFKFATVAGASSRYTRLSDIRGFAPYRVSAFAIPKDERVETLSVEVGDLSYTEHTRTELHREFPGITYLVRKINEQAKPEHGQQLLDKAAERTPEEIYA